MNRGRRRVDALLDFAVARGAIVVGLAERVVTHPATRRAAVAVAAIGALLLLLSLVPHERVEPCQIPGHARTTVVECEQR